jgi:hypothetical protein
MSVDLNESQGRGSRIAGRHFGLGIPSLLKHFANMIG